MARQADRELVIDIVRRRPMGVTHAIVTGTGDFAVAINGSANLQPEPEGLKGVD